MGLALSKKSGKKADIEVIEYLLKYGEDVNRPINHKKDTPLILASKYKSTEVIKTLIRAGAKINARNNNGRTALHYAAKFNGADEVSTLVSAGADIHARDHGEITPLNLAALSNGKSVIKTLIRAGANIHARDERGETPLHYALHGNAKNIVRLLILSGASLADTSYLGTNALHAAARSREAERENLIEYLINQGLDINSVDNSGETALHYLVYAAMYSTPDDIRDNIYPRAKFLISKGADRSAKIQDGYNKGKTPYEFALSKSIEDQELLKLLKPKT